MWLASITVNFPRLKKETFDIFGSKNLFGGYTIFIWRTVCLDRGGFFCHVLSSNYIFSVQNCKDRRKNWQKYNNWIKTRSADTTWKKNDPPPFFSVYPRKADVRIRNQFMVTTIKKNEISTPNNCWDDTPSFQNYTMKHKYVSIYVSPGNFSGEYRATTTQNQALLLWFLL